MATTDEERCAPKVVGFAADVEALLRKYGKQSVLDEVARAAAQIDEQQRAAHQVTQQFGNAIRQAFRNCGMTANANPGELYDVAHELQKLGYGKIPSLTEVTERVVVPDTCPLCRHAAHLPMKCLNMASDNDCKCGAIS